MKHGICNLSIVPLRADASDRSEQISQMLFGETFTIVEETTNWIKIILLDDGYEGWIDRKQHLSISVNAFEAFQKKQRFFAADTVQMLSDPQNYRWQQLAVQGSVFYDYRKPDFDFVNQKLTYNGEVWTGKKSKAEIIDIAYSYLNVPYLWGGKTPFGIDCSGFSQIVYKMCGHALPRDAKDQAKLGEALSFIEEAEPGDLAFFDNEEGNIVHVGILLADNYIIHASGKVRLDRLDQYGISNNEQKKHTHRLRVIKKIF